ncbi:MAG TPA: 6-hydroxymethylpterin diphosphokinase MptE-like protein [Candidatus Nitrosocosmicus sp.]|nr:6-hydroxymethylpterin diphosphokinase MptE-like protein [Candidatus Nitrosocosmicus sp.]
MRFNDWYPHYLIIAHSLGLKARDDFVCTLILSELLSRSYLDPKCLVRLSGKKVLIIGAGPSIEEYPIQEFIKDCVKGSGPNPNKKTVVIVADGATELCLSLDIIPDIVISDLDGDLNSLLIAEEKGSTVIVHGHGDNIDKIKTHVSDFSRVIGTTQTFPLYNIHNFGGFTDGDRGIFLARHFNAKQIILVGMDFDSKIGHYSKKNILNAEQKKRKLKVAKYLVQLLCNNNNNNNSSQFLNIASSKYGSSISGNIKNKLI